MNNFNYSKEFLRGSLKELMKTRGLRSISFANYDRFTGNRNHSMIHTVNLNLENGFIRFYRYNEDETKKTRGKVFEDVTPEMYGIAYEELLNILNNEKNIPSRERRNILVGMYR